MSVSRSKSTKLALMALATQCLASLAPAQDYPPPPPVPVRVVQAPEPTPIGPVLPELNKPTPVAPLPADLVPLDPSMAVPDDDVEAFARGPVHEAFADVYELDPSVSEVVTTAPPAVVDELPPEQAPTGENVQWISGYWSWDIEAKDYMWVSGVWRDVPPGRRWVPGYWAEVTGGFQWVGGFWADAQVQELTYVPPPPESLEVGPNVPPPSDDQIWVPGNWSYVSNDYRWSPGYYTPCQPDYMWVPCQYNWTPRGCVYVPGYWDYRFARRGVLFSPVRFRRPFLAYGFARPAYYRPRYSVAMGGFMIHLFVRPRHRHFYYGDYYGNQYAGLGFSPWYRRSFVNRRIHDPALSFYRWDSHRRGVDFDRSVGQWHQRYESNVQLRPPRLIRDQDQFLSRHQGDRSAQLAVMTNRFDDLVKRPPAGESFRRIEPRDIELQREHSKVTRNLESVRRQVEHDDRVGRPGAQLPGNIVDLRSKEIRERAGRDGSAREAFDRSRLPEKLVLTDMPDRLKEKTRESVATAERIRRKAGTPADGADAGRPVGGPRDLGKDHNPDRGSATEAGNAERDRTARSGRTGDRTVPSTENSERRGRMENPPSREGKPQVTQEAGGTGADRLQEIRQRIEERKLSREAGPAGTPGRVGNDNAGPRGSSSRILEGGPLKMEKPSANPDRQSGRVIEDSSARQRVDEIRQPAEVRRQAPAPDASVNRPPRVIDRTPQNNASTPRERVIREREVPVPRIKNEAPAARSQPIERAPRMERAPVERAPRIERAPVERAPRVERPPVERRAPVERAPRSPDGPAGRRGRKSE